MEGTTLSLFESFNMNVIQTIATHRNPLLKVAEVDLIYKTNVKPSERAKITKSLDAVKLLRPLYGDYIEHRELFFMLLLNRNNRVLGSFEVSRGGVGATVADPKLIFQAALKSNASGIIVSHNHPSGGLSPSQADIDFTKKIKAGGKLLDIQLLDHIILSPEEDKHYSFADEGII